MTSQPSWTLGDGFTWTPDANRQVGPTVDEAFRFLDENVDRGAAVHLRFHGIDGDSRDIRATVTKDGGGYMLTPVDLLPEPDSDDEF